MTFVTSSGALMSATMLGGYIRSLVNRFFKILPIKESGEDSLETYMRSLQAELIGFKDLVTVIHEDSDFVSLLSILQYLIDNPGCQTTTVRREVFRAISICNKLKAKYAQEMDSETGAM